MKFVAAKDIAISRETIFSEKRHIAPNCLNWTNGDLFNARFFAMLKKDVYIQRECTNAAITLGRMPKDVEVNGLRYFSRVHTDYISDQILPADQEKLRNSIDLWPNGRRVEFIDCETLLVARFGHRVWGHWLIEMLPKIVMAEAFFPGRFRYAVDADLLQPGEQRDFRRSMHESLRAYGVEPERLIGLHGDRDYRFASLWTITPVISDYTAHPAVIEMMNRNLCIGSSAPVRRVALLRSDVKTRFLANRDEIAEFLQKRSFHILETGKMSFLDQVRLFREARAVVGVMGSALAGFLYSPYDVRVAAVAPPKFPDRFFWALIQHHNGRYADVRGPIVEPDTDYPGRDDSFSIATDDLGEALDSIGA